MEKRDLIIKSLDALLVKQRRILNELESLIRLVSNS